MESRAGARGGPSSILRASPADDGRARCVSDSGRGSCRLVYRKRRAKSYRQPVPGVDRADEKREIGQFLVVERGARLFVNGVGCMVLRNERERFGPGERGLLAVVEQHRLAPSGQNIEALLGL